MDVTSEEIADDKESGKCQRSQAKRYVLLELTKKTRTAFLR